MPLLALVFAITWILSTAMAAHLPRLLQEARFGQALAPFLFALLIERFGSGALVVSSALGLLALGALTLLQHLTRHDHAPATTP